MNLDPVALTWAYLGILNKKRYEALLQAFGSLEAALPALSPELLKNLGCRQDTIEATLVRISEFDPEAYTALIAKKGITLISIEDESYPRMLKDLPDAPVFLSARGDLGILNQPCIGIVGTRTMTDYGKRVAEDFSTACVRAGVTTVSGLAYGVDTIVAQSTVDAGGKTVAVLAHGLGSITPRENTRLAEKIVKTGGLLLTEFPLDQLPDKYAFPSRNRVIAGLSIATVVVEAGVESGALITADLASGYGREVFAVPGPIFEPMSQGCHQLIARSKARIAVSPEAVLRELKIVAPSSDAPIYLPQNEDERAMYEALTSMPQSTTDLAERTGLPPGNINATLTILELSGAAKSAGQGMWVRG